MIDTQQYLRRPSILVMIATLMLIAAAPRLVSRIVNGPPRSYCYAGRQTAAPAAESIRRNDSLASLRAMIDSSIRMIKARAYEEFLRRHVNPEQLADAIGKESFEEVLEHFTGKAPTLLKMLKRVRKMKPTFEPDEKGTIASYRIKKAIEGRDHIEFIKIGGKWFLMN